MRGLPPFVTPVGVFWDHPPGTSRRSPRRAGCGALQFHGDETPEDLAGYALPVIKTIKLPPVSTIDGLPEYRIGGFIDALYYRNVVAAILLDSAARWSEGEAREPIAWQRIARDGRPPRRPDAHHPVAAASRPRTSPSAIAYRPAVTRWT